MVAFLGAVRLGAVAFTRSILSFLSAKAPSQAPKSESFLLLALEQEIFEGFVAGALTTVSWSSLLRGATLELLFEALPQRLQGIVSVFETLATTQDLL